MDFTLIDAARKAIAETCMEVDFSKSPTIYIPIKDNKIKVSTNINSLKNADECMLLLPYIWNNTVPSYSGHGTVTFKNTLRRIVHIDKEGNVCHFLYPNDSALQISCNCYCYGADVKLCLKWNSTTLYQSKHFFPTVEDFHEVWKLYQASKKIMDIMEKGFDDERAELQSEIDELTKKYSDLKKKQKSVNKKRKA